MPKPKKGPRLESNPAHQKLLLSTMAAQLFVHEGIETTEAKAKQLRPFAEAHHVREARDLAARRQVLRDIPDRDVVAKLFHEIGPRFEEREEATRILKLSPRKGDGAPMARIELVEREWTSEEQRAVSTLGPVPASILPR